MKVWIKNAIVLLVITVLVVLSIGFVIYTTITQSKTSVVVNAAVYENLSIVELIPQIKSGVVHIKTPDWQGSGFVVDSNLIMTARHVVEGVEDFEITTDDGHKLHATRALSSNNHDVGFIYVNDLTCVAEDCEKDGALLGEHKVKLHPLKLGSITECQLGETLIAIGSPFGIDNFNSVTQGILSAAQRDFDLGYTAEWGWSTLFQTDANGEGGNSGCPLFNIKGKVVGVLVGKMSNGIVYCIPSDVFAKDLDMIKLMFRQNNYYFEKKADVAEEAWGY